MCIFLSEKDSATIEWGDTLNNSRLLEGVQTMKLNLVAANSFFSLYKRGFEKCSCRSTSRFLYSIPLIRKKSYTDVLFIYVSKGFKTGKNQNTLQGEYIENIVTIYKVFKLILGWNMKIL